MHSSKSGSSFSKTSDHPEDVLTLLCLGKKNISEKSLVKFEEVGPGAEPKLSSPTSDPKVASKFLVAFRKAKSAQFPCNLSRSFTLSTGRHNRQVVVLCGGHDDVAGVLRIVPLP